MSDLPFDHLPPHSVRAEMRRLATIMLSDCPPRSDLVVAHHRTLFDLMCELHDKATPIDAMIVKERLEATGLLGEFGGAREAMPSGTHLQEPSRPGDDFKHASTNRLART